MSLTRRAFEAAVVAALAATAGCGAPGGGATPSGGALTGHTVTGDTLIADVIAHPLLGDYGRFLFPITFRTPGPDIHGAATQPFSLFSITLNGGPVAPVG